MMIIRRWREPSVTTSVSEVRIELSRFIIPAQFHESVY
jgi:hypothetical protein